MSVILSLLCAYNNINNGEVLIIDIIDTDTAAGLERILACMQINSNPPRARAPHSVVSA